MTSPRSLLVALPSALLVLAACTGRPSAEEVVDRSSPVICDKAKECVSTFALSFPGGTSECVTKVKAETTKKYGGDLDGKVSACTDEEVDACLQKLKTAACPGDDKLPQPPCDC